MRIKSWVIPYLFLLLCGAFISTFSYAVDYESNSSSNAVSVSAVVLIPNSGPGDILSKVIISSRSAGNETFSIYDSSGVATNVLGVIDTSTSSFNTFNEYVYNHRVSSGITVSKNGANASVILLWKNVR